MSGWLDPLSSQTSVTDATSHIAHNVTPDDYAVPMATATNRKAPAVFTTVFLLNCNIVDSMDLQLALHAADLLATTTRPSHISGDGLAVGCVSGTAGDDQCWICVKDGREARKLIVEHVGTPADHDFMWS